MIQTLLVGYGYWGRILADNLTQHPTFFLAGVQDASQSVILDARANIKNWRRWLKFGIR